MENQNTTVEETKAVEVQAQEQQAPEAPAVVEEKKKVDWKGIGKKVLIGAAAVASVVGAFAVGRATAKHSDEPEDEFSEFYGIVCADQQAAQPTQATIDNGGQY